MIVHQVDEKTYFKSWSFSSSRKTSLCSVNYNYWMILVPIVVTNIRETFNPFSIHFMHVLLLQYLHIHTIECKHWRTYFCRSFIVRKVQILLLTDYFLMVIQGYHLCFNMSRIFMKIFFYGTKKHILPKHIYAIIAPYNSILLALTSFFNCLIKIFHCTEWKILEVK